jgi:hypothetical protein
VWRTVGKLKRGADKWRHWNLQNIQDENGIASTSPEGNADNFCSFYNRLCDNDGEDGGKAGEWHDKMEQRPMEREWCLPQLFELRRAVREFKNASPGLSGIAAVVWKAMMTNGVMEGAMLETMQGCWTAEKVPSTWLNFYMAVLAKKGDLSLPGNYRGIAVGETLSKVHTHILKFRLQDLHETMAPCASCRGQPELWSPYCQ